MFIPARILRATARSLDPNPRYLTTREREREERVLSLGKGLLAIYGRNAIKFGEMAAGLEISPTTLRRHFTDLDALLGEILRLHLRGLSSAIGEVDADDPDRFKNAAPPTSPTPAPRSAASPTPTCSSSAISNFSPRTNATASN
jgi:AcrR family transcriptional regulator